MAKRKWGKWSPRQMCIRTGKIIFKKPKGLSYEGLSEHGTHYFRKSDNTSYIQTRRCKDGKEVYVKL